MSVLFGCRVVCTDEEMEKKLESLLSKKVTGEELDTAIPGLGVAAHKAMRSLEVRNCRAERLVITGRTIQAFPSESFSAEGDPITF